MPLTTYKDVIDHAIDFMGGDSTPEALHFARRAVNAAYREVPNCRRWSYFYNTGRINTVASYGTGTIDYANSTRTLTLSGGTWPSWAANGTVLIETVPYEVASRDSGTVLILSRSSNPGQDIAAGTEFTIYQDTYVLPADFLAADEIIIMNHSTGLTFQHPRDYLASQRITISPSIPRIYSITGDPNYFGAMAVKFYPPPDLAYVCPFIYQRRPRALNWEQYATGLATTTSGSTTIAGTDTNWLSTMIGAVIRFAPAGETENIPTGKTGSDPFYIERIIMDTALDINNNVTLIVDIDPGVNLTGVAYSISDPIDIEDGAMLTYLLREVEKQLRLVRRMKMTNEEGEAYKLAMWAAWEADSRSIARRADGYGVLYRPRLADMPRGADVS